MNYVASRHLDVAGGTVGARIRLSPWEARQRPTSRARRSPPNALEYSAWGPTNAAPNRSGAQGYIHLEDSARAYLSASDYLPVGFR